MAKFVYVYTGGQMAETPAAQEEAMQAWGAWFGTLGDAVTDGGNPFGRCGGNAAFGQAGLERLAGRRAGAGCGG